MLLTFSTLRPSDSELVSQILRTRFVSPMFPEGAQTRHRGQGELEPKHPNPGSLAERFRIGVSHGGKPGSKAKKAKSGIIDRMAASHASVML